MATIVIKVRDEKVHSVISDEPLKVIVADYDTISSNEDPYGSPCFVCTEYVFEDPDEVKLFEKILRDRRERMLKENKHE